VIGISIKQAISINTRKPKTTRRRMRNKVNLTFCRNSKCYMDE